MSQAKKFKELINNTFEIAQTIDGVKTVYVSGDDTKLYVNKHFGNAYCYYDNTTDLKADFEHFNRLHVTDFIRLLKALQFDYNPCENFDKYSDITVTHSGTIGTTNNSTVTSKVNAFDSQSLVTDAENFANGGNTTTLNNSDGTIEHTHGNIGVQTVSNMILQSGTGEAYLRFNSFVEHYINRWISGCIVGYGDEENEIEYAPSTEYATKTELETLAQSTSDALNSITNTVNSHGESINTLDSSLGGVIEDIEEIGGVLEDHETRIETLELSPSVSQGEITVNLDSGFSIFSGRELKYRIGNMCFYSAMVVNANQLNINIENKIATSTIRPKKLIFGICNINNYFNDVYIRTDGSICLIPRSGNIPSNSRIVVNLMWEIPEPL